MRQAAAEKNERYVEMRREKVNAKRRPHGIEPGDVVFLSVRERAVGNARKLSPYFAGPYLVESFGTNPNNLICVNLADHSVDEFNAARLLKYSSDNDYIAGLIKNFKSNKKNISEIVKAHKQMS